MKTVVYFTLGAMLMLLVAALVYLHGLWTGHFIDLRGPGEYCSANRVPFHRTAGASYRSGTCATTRTAALQT